MDNTKAPGIKIEQVILDSFYLKKKDNIDLSQRYNVKVDNTVEFGIDETAKHGRVKLTINIIEKSDCLFSIDTSYILIASQIAGEENMPIRQYLETNAPATLYQFARETVLTMSQKAGIPLILPPINLANK